MASSSSRRKNASKNSDNRIAELLQTGAKFTDPDPSIVEIAQSLEQQRIIIVDGYEFVRCIYPSDPDYSWYSNRSCSGEIRIGPDIDDSGGEVRCPECERMIRFHRKRRFKGLRASVVEDGVLAFIESTLREAKYEFSELCHGAFQVESDRLGITVCVVDYCQDSSYLASKWPQTVPTCYIIVDPTEFERRIPHARGISALSLATIIQEKAQLVEAIESLRSNGCLDDVRTDNLALFRTPIPQPQNDSLVSRIPKGMFLVCLGSYGVTVNGVLVVNASDKARFRVFKVLWSAFCGHLSSGFAEERHHPLNLKEIDKRLAKRFKGARHEDLENLRTTINRLRRDIAEGLRESRGDVITEQSIIEIIPCKGKNADPHGYRINPKSVIIKAFSHQHE